MTSEGKSKLVQYFWPGGQEGEAYYSQHIAVRTWPSMEPVKAALSSAVDRIPFSAKDGRPFVIADYGCQDGGVAMPVIRGVVDRVRQKYKPVPDVHIMYEDLPYADLKSLFLMANGLTGSQFESAWSRQDGVYFSAVGRSFFEQCFPSNSVHVGMSSHAIMHLSTRPCKLPDVLVPSLCMDDKRRALFTQQAASDWETFLLNRCRELVPGGVLFVVAFYTTDDGQHLGSTKGGRNQFEVIHNIWKQLYEEGRITKTELEEPTFNYYMNTVQEFKAPFLNKESKVYKDGLRLLSLETLMVPCVYHEAVKKFGTNDPEVLDALVQEFVMATRSWADGDFLAALSSRPEPERREIVNELFRRYGVLVRSEPTLHKNDQVLAHIMMQKMS